MASAFSSSSSAIINTGGGVATMRGSRHQYSYNQHQQHQHQPPLYMNSLFQLYSSTSSSSSSESQNLLSDEEIDPYSEQAKLNLFHFYQQNNMEHNRDAEKDHKKLLRLMEQVLSWNQRLNLISRKDCTPEVVYHRHILPSIALMPLVLKSNSSSNNKSSNDDNDDSSSSSSSSNQPLKIVDVGTGGGFPGLPLALLLPNCEFTLVDSIQKKLVAVSEMAAELDVTNVRIHCGRCEEMYAEKEGRKEHLGKYDVCLGRSVTALPRFCAWMHPLLKKKKQKDNDDEGRLIYIIGGELEDVVESRIQSDTYLDELLHRQEGTSDKRALIFLANDVEEIAVESGEIDKILRSAPPGMGRKNRKGSKTQQQQQQQGKNKVAKGAWQKRDNAVKKERGYDDFQRFES